MDTKYVKMPITTSLLIELLLILFFRSFKTSSYLQRWVLLHYHIFLCNSGSMDMHLLAWVQLNAAGMGSNCWGGWSPNSLLMGQGSSECRCLGHVCTKKESTCTQWSLTTALCFFLLLQGTQKSPYPIRLVLAHIARVIEC